jgi:predicted transposase/invertase (TIGR01784 family)
MARTLISFDWALKRLLRQKANYIILEGFLSVLLNRDIVILSLLESESNADDAEQKINRVDILVENDQKERLIIELQYSKEFDYFQRILFATSKHLTETLQKGSPYQDIKKIFSINLIYFDLGDGDDYVYQGKTEFRGIHQNDVLKLSAKQKELFLKDAVYEIFPEYYVIKINNFDDVAKDSLDEWIYYFKNNEIKDEFNARGLAEVKAQLQFDELSEQERYSYQQYEKDLLSQKSTILTARIEGKAEGLAEGLAEGKAEGLAAGKVEGEYQAKLNMARKMKDDGLSDELIEKYTGLSLSTVQTL